MSIKNRVRDLEDRLFRLYGDRRVQNEVVMGLTRQIQDLEEQLSDLQAKV